MNDERVRYKVANKALGKRAALLSRLSDAAEQRREIGLIAAGIEDAVNQGNWGLVEKLTSVLVKLRESQLRARKENEELVSIDKFRHAVLAPLLDAITARLQAALPNDWERTIDLLESDLKGIHPRLQPQRLLEDQR